MKNTFLCFFLILNILNGQAQLAKSVGLTAPGLLNICIPLEDRGLLTDLIVSGPIDARDFKFMRDSLPKLSSLDLSASTVKSYAGTLGTIPTETTYQADAIPSLAFKYKRTLTEIKLPAFLKSIEKNAFLGNVFKTIEFPDSLETIGEQAFSFCDSLKVVRIPNAVKSIGNGAFGFCKALSELRIGNSIQSLGYSCFGYCTGLKSIYVTRDEPLNLESLQSAFTNIDTKTCVLNVPMGAMPNYAQSVQWKMFSNIVEDSIGYYPLQKNVRLAAGANSSASVKVISSVAWTYSCDQSWLKIVRTGKLGNDTLTLTAEANISSSTRYASLLLTSIGLESKVITVQQTATPKIIQVVAGGLLSCLTPVERRSVSNLVLTGTIDSRDFRILRDSMTMLSTLDLSAVDILTYSGFYGTSTSNDANTIPQYAFFNSDTYTGNTKLETIILPVSATSIGNYAFQFCSVLSEVVVQKNIRIVGDHAFENCTNLTSIDLSKSVASIGYTAFSNCSNLRSATMGDSLKTLGSYAFANCLVLDSVCLGNSLTKLGNTAFGSCSMLSDINLPETVTSIGGEAFRYCSRLKNIYLNWLVPLAFSNDYMTFLQVDTINCVLHIPYGSKTLYAATTPWSSFQKVVESSIGLKLDTQMLTLSNKVGSKAAFRISSNTNWTVHSDQSWLHVSSTVGFGDSTIELVAEANTLSETRTARVTVQSPGLKTQYVDVIQESSIKYVTVAAGGLYSALTARERKNIDKLVIQGTIDASDIRILRDSLPKLMMLDMYQTVIAAYTGVDGTSDYKSYETYPINTIPHHAFSNQYDYRSSGLKTVILPHSITAIEFCAFQSCAALDSLTIPETVTKLGNSAFSGCASMKKLTFSNSIKNLPYYICHYCLSLTEITLPDSVTNIDDYAFSDCTSLTNLTFGEKLLSIGESAFENCYKLKRVNLPGTLKTIGEFAFDVCSFESLSIPQSVSSIGSYAFFSRSLKAVYVYTKTPLLLNSSSVFQGLDYLKCTLYVPKGSKTAYESDYYWSQFANIVEGKGMSFSEQNIRLVSGGQKSIELSSSQNWTLTCNQSWLSFSQTSGDGDSWITISAQKNPSYADRSALVTVVSADSTIPNMEVSVVESGAEKTVLVTPNGLYASLTKGEVHSVSNLVLKGEMDARDFRILRDSMPQLVLIDMSAVTIKSYLGDFGTVGYSYYLANALPPESFSINYTGKPNGTLSMIRFPENLVAIGTAAFKSAIGLTSIVFPNKVSSIGTEAFFNCTALDSVNFGTSLLTIGQSAFSNCSMKSLELPNTVQTIEASAFSESPRLSTVVFPSSVTYIGSQAFYGCPQLKKVVLPSALKTLEKNVFGTCWNLTDVFIPESVTTIRENAFGNCSSLTSITIPSKVTKIENGAFGFCLKLTSIYALPVLPVDLTASINYNVFCYLDKNICTLFVPAGSKALYASSVEWKDFVNIVEQGASVSLEHSEKLAISPNPVRNNFNIRGLNGEAEFTLTDLNGKVKRTGSVFGDKQLSAEGLPEGMYLLRIKTSEGVFNLKLIKEN